MHLTAVNPFVMEREAWATLPPVQLDPQMKLLPNSHEEWVRIETPGDPLQMVVEAGAVHVQLVSDGLY